MKTAIVISGLPNKVEEGYNQFWKSIIEKYNADVYLHFWEDGEYEKVLSLYNPKKYISEKPLSFINYIDIPSTELNNGNANFRQFSMFYGWQEVCKLIEDDYECVIRGRYNLTGYCNLENIDNSKINVSNYHWPNSKICDDNLYVSNSDLYRKIFYDSFDSLREDTIKFGLKYSPEIHFTKLIDKKGLYNLVTKTFDLRFDIIR